MGRTRPLAERLHSSDGEAAWNDCLGRIAAEGRMSALGYGWIKPATRMRGRSNVMETCSYNFR